ncbi:MAG: hypothetical protein KUG69_01890 [Marinosulfonomonas sp.]|nr:hypothetical protein [Marinosulfonomonas sp.]
MIQRFRDFEDGLEAEFDKRRAALDLKIEKGRLVLSEELRRRNKALRTGIFGYLRHARLLAILTAPFIYALVLPLVLLDLFVSLYQAICFPAYRISKVARGDHIVFDRHLLGYLNGIEKLNCIFCSYANGLLSYASEIASRTEAHWCPIKHQARVSRANGRYLGFAEYGDPQGYQERVSAARARQISES